MINIGNIEKRMATEPDTSDEKLYIRSKILAYMNAGLYKKGL